MCGIIGQIDRATPVNRGNFDGMVDSLSSRGPDGRGTVFLNAGHVALGHRRLSIIDLSDAGRQPMSNQDGTVWMTFNGEIYNFKSLRQELEHSGYSFRSHTDSEVIIYAYEKWGIDCVRRFRGIFAFGIYDCRSDSLFLARDHIGVKPLYYYYDGNNFVFASQPKAILEAERLSVKVDHESFSLYLAYGNVPADRSIYQGIKKLLPGHRLLLREGRVDVSCYWKLEYSPMITNREEAERAVAEKVEECVVAQSVSDVPIGTLLSGGVDSTIMTGILASDGHAALDTFTIGFDEEESDESRYARLVADAYHTGHHHRWLPYETATAMLPGIIEAYDEPFHLNGLFPMLAVSRLVQDNHGKVVLGGDGGDELFAGYRWYDSFAGRFGRESSRTARLKGQLRSLVGKSTARRDPVSDFFRFNGSMNNTAQVNWAGPSLRSAITDVDLLEPLRRHWHPEYPSVLAAQFMDFNCFLVDHCLSKVDRASMACGVEVRVPLLDPELVSLVFSIDHDIIYSGGERKALFKRSLNKYLPEGLDTTRKKGFSSPMGVWLGRGLADSGKSLLLDGSLCSHGYLNADTIQNTYSASGAQIQLLLLGAELWFRRWIDGDKQTIRTFSEYVSR